MNSTVLSFAMAEQQPHIVGGGATPQSTFSFYGHNRSIGSVKSFQDLTSSETGSQCDDRDPSWLASPSSEQSSPFRPPTIPTSPKPTPPKAKIVEITHSFLETVARRLVRFAETNPVEIIVLPPASGLPQQLLVDGATVNPDLLILFSSAVPRMAFMEYFQRLLTYAHCSLECHAIALCYVNRLRVVGFPLTLRSLHRTYLGCLLLAIKNHDDFFFPQSYYAQCGGVVKQELGRMEVQCFTLLGFDCFADPSELPNLAFAFEVAA
jgi:hypothetical protein